MNASTKELLAVVGAQLDELTFPLVKNGGFVMPRDNAATFIPLGKENGYEYKRQAGSSTESWTGPGRREGSAGGRRPPLGSRSPGAAAQVLGAYQGDGYLTEVSAIRAAYPGAQAWSEEDGFWLYAESHLLPGLNRVAGLLLGVSHAKRRVRAWGFWSTGVLGASWIGPRHTNFPDGSICAYEPNDGTWLFGQSLVSLLDIYSVWALRHLHFEMLGRWPGPQAVHIPYERILEVAGDEHCPCGFTGRRYAECCQPTDLKADRLALAVSLVCESNVRMRSPPAAIKKFAMDRKSVPSISDLI